MTVRQSREAAIECIDDGDTIGIGGFVAVGIPEYVLEALGERYAETGTPAISPSIIPLRRVTNRAVGSRISFRTACSSAPSRATGALRPI